MKNCTICGKPIVLVPSAKSRAKAFGQTPEYYENMFSEHGECTVLKRERETLDLIKRIQDESASSDALGGSFPDGL